MNLNSLRRRDFVSRRDFIKAAAALSAFPLQVASRARITDVRIRRLKVAKEVGTYPDWVGGTRFGRVGGGAIMEVVTDQGVTGIGPDVDPALLPRIKMMRLAATPLIWPRTCRSLHRSRGTVFAVRPPSKSRCGMSAGS
jgi:hypothetical protein